MPIAAGARLGAYEILTLIGSGGMGEVYRARDTKLSRDVALKVLPSEFTSDPERLARFKREAQVLASLDHPNIGAIHGFEDADGVQALVLQLVEGPTLADRISLGQIPVDEALPIARQIAEALEAAHDQGIIHRDLKPANIKVRHDGAVKVLDFGLAKLLDADAVAGQPRAYSPAVTNSPTITTPAMTQMGVILGTAAYMAPEQAKGLPADHRSDVFSLGSVLYEILTGRAAFHGDTPPDILASVLVREPDYSALPSNLNPRIPELLRRCLEKNPKKRWQAVGDLRAEIETIAAAPHATTVEPMAPPRPLWRRAMPVVTGTVLATAITSVAWWSVRPSLPPPTVTRFSFTLAEGERFIDLFLPQVAISPDGTQIAYVANRRIHLRSMSELTSRTIPGTEYPGFIGAPVFSPDGRSLAFWTQSGSSPSEARQPGMFKRISLTGGAAVTVCQASVPFGAIWDSTGIVFGQALTAERGIVRCSPNGGKPELIVRVKSDEIAQGPQMLPGGDAVLFTLARGYSGDTAILTSDFWDKANVVVQSLKGGEIKTVIEGASDARYLPTGDLLYALGGTLLAVPFDARRREVTGGPVSVLEGVSRPTSFGNGPATAQASISSTGSLVYIPGPLTTSAQAMLVVVDPRGGIQPLKTPPGSYRYPRVAPNGKRVAVGIDDARGTNIWIYDLAGTTAIRQLTFGGKNQFPVWVGDDAVAFQSDREGEPSIFRQRADGATPAERLTRADQGTAHVPESVSPDGRMLLYDVVKASQREHALWSLSIADRKAAPFGNARSLDAAIASKFSPDGKWVAYGASLVGNMQVFVEPYPRTGSQYVIGDGTHPIWSRDGRSLSYEWQGQLFTVPVTTQPAFSFGTATSVPRSTVYRSTQESYRDSMPDGRYLGVTAGEVSLGIANAQIQVILNWSEELKQRVPTK
jgi:eukaryotic-like serine/threonine-protein kinase